MSFYQNTGASVRFAAGFARDRDSLLRRLGQFARAWQKRARYRAELARPDDRALMDVGFDKATVELEAVRPFWFAPLGAWQELARAYRRRS